MWEGEGGRAACWVEGGRDQQHERQERGELFPLALADCPSMGFRPFASPRRVRVRDLNRDLRS